MTSRIAPALILLVLLVLLGGCGGADYCESVEQHQSSLGEIVGSGTPDALLRALPEFRELAEDAPDDLKDDWKTVIDGLAGLEQALDAAGIDPATYDRAEPPGGLSDADAAAIDEAAAALAEPGFVNAFNGVQQQALDVCHTSLTL